MVHLENNFVDVIWEKSCLFGAAVFLNRLILIENDDQRRKQGFRHHLKGILLIWGQGGNRLILIENYVLRSKPLCRRHLGEIWLI